MLPPSPAAAMRDLPLDECAKFLGVPEPALRTMLRIVRPGHRGDRLSAAELDRAAEILPTVLAPATPAGLARRRAMLGLSIHALAAALRTRRNTVCAWERGIAPIPPELEARLRALEERDQGGA